MAKIIAADEWRTPMMAQTLAAGNQREIEAHVGDVSRLYPIEIETDPGAVAADFELSGGLGYVAMTFNGYRDMTVGNCKLHQDRSGCRSTSPCMEMIIGGPMGGFGSVTLSPIMFRSWTQSLPPGLARS